MTGDIEILQEGKPPRYFPVRTFDELTLQDWRDLTVPKVDEGIVKKFLTAVGMREMMDVENEMLRRHTGMPLWMLRKMPTGERELLVETIGETLKKAVEAGGKEDKLYVPPDTLTVAGRTFTVPKDLERDTIHGQWMDLSTADNFEDEADVIVRFLAVLLIEQGQEYAGDQVKAKEAVFMGLKMIDVFPLASFFFGNSERFRNAVDLAFDRYRSSKQHSVRQELKALFPTMGSTSKPSEPPS